MPAAHLRDDKPAGWGRARSRTVPANGHGELRVVVRSEIDDGAGLLLSEISLQFLQFGAVPDDRSSICPPKLLFFSS
jgi:hypothetical protein